MLVTFRFTVAQRSNYMYAVKFILWTSSIMAVLILVSAGTQVYVLYAKNDLLSIFAIFAINPSSCIYMISQLGFTYGRIKV